MSLRADRAESVGGALTRSRRYMGADERKGRSERRKERNVGKAAVIMDEKTRRGRVEASGGKSNTMNARRGSGIREAERREPVEKQRRRRAATQTRSSESGERSRCGGDVARSCFIYLRPVASSAQVEFHSWNLNKGGQGFSPASSFASLSRNPECVLSTFFRLLLSSSGLPSPFQTDPPPPPPPSSFFVTLFSSFFTISRVHVQQPDEDYLAEVLPRV